MADTNELVLVANESGLEQEKLTGLLAKFAEPFQQARDIVAQAQGIVVTNETQTAEMEEARFARLELKKLRVDVEHTRKELKEQSLREGKAVDGMANIIKAIIVPTEEYLEKQEKFAERLAEERRARMIAERQSKLAGHVSDTSVYKFEDMTDAAFAELIKQLEEAEKARIEAERRAIEAVEEQRKKDEAERLAREKAQAEEAERIRKENAKLRAEAEAREAEIAKQRAAEAKRLEIERAEQEKKLADERQKREALEAAQAAKDAAEAKAKAEAEETQRKSLLAPDKDKLVKFADMIDTIELPNVSNREAGKLLDETKDFLARISKNLRTKATAL